MAISLGNRAKMSTSTTGTGTITLGSAVSGYQSFANAGITNGQTVRYAIEDGTAFEIGSGTYTSSGTTLTRSVTESSNSDSAITLSGNAEVFVTATVADLYINDGASTLTTTGVITGGTVEATSDTAAGDNAAMGYQSDDGLVLTGQGAVRDVTIKNDADATVISIPTGTTNVTVAGNLGVGGTVTATGTSVFATLDISGDVDVDGTLESDAITLNGTAVTATATLSTGISNNNVPKFTSGVADNDFLRVDGTAIEGRSASEVLSDIGAAPAAGSSNIVTTGALNSGSITSGFGTIDTGSSNITTTGVGSFGSLDISGAIDVDGTTNLDAVDIDGAVQLDATLTVGVDDTGYDVKFFGDAASAFMQWDASADDLILGGAAGLIVPDGKLTLGSTAVTSTGAEINQLDALTRGSILYGNASGATARLAKGAANTVLTSDGTDISYAALSVAVGLDGSGNPTLASTVTPAEMRTLISAAEAQIGTPVPNWANPTNTYTSSGTWSKGSLADDALVWMYAVGGGSSGGSGGSSNPSSPQRGGLGGLSFFVLGTAAQLNGAQYVIGAGGAAANDAEGNAGGATTLTVSGVTYTTGNPDNSGNVNTGRTVLSGTPDGAATSTTAFFFTYAYPAFFTTTVDETKFKGSPSSGTGHSRGAVYDDGTTSEQPSNNISEYGGDAGASPNQNSSGNAGAVPGGGGSAAFGAVSGAGGAGNLRVYHL